MQVLFGLLERLPEAECVEFLRRHLPVFPTLNHQALAHEPAAVEHLRSLLNSTSGLTVIESEFDYARQFILSAFRDGFGQCLTALGETLILTVTFADADRINWKSKT